MDIFQRTVAVFLLALICLIFILEVYSNRVEAGEVIGPGGLIKIPENMAGYVCKSEESVLFRLDNYQKIKSGKVDLPSDCGVIRLPTDWIGEYTYLDDEGDESVVTSYELPNGTTIWSSARSMFLVGEEA